MTMKRKAATSHSMKTCFVTEKLIPNIVGSGISGSLSPLLETCSMITSPGLNASAFSPAACAASAACGSWIMTRARKSVANNRLSGPLRKQAFEVQRFDYVQSHKIAGKTGDERDGPEA